MKGLKPRLFTASRLSTLSAGIPVHIEAGLGLEVLRGPPDTDPCHHRKVPGRRLFGRAPRGGRAGWEMFEWYKMNLMAFARPGWRLRGATSTRRCGVSSGRVAWAHPRSLFPSGTRSLPCACARESGPSYERPRFRGVTGALSLRAASKLGRLRLRRPGSSVHPDIFAPTHGGSHPFGALGVPALEGPRRRLPAIAREDAGDAS